MPAGDSPTRPRPTRLAVPVALVVAGILSVVPARAEAAHVQCGDTITADATLDANLVDCPNNGLVIGADGVELDLNGHRIDGDGTEFEDCPRDENCDAGVLVDGHKRVTIKHGSVREFAIGVLILRARAVAVKQVSSTRNDLFGALFAASRRGIVRSSSMSRNVAPEGDGIGILDCDLIAIIGTSIRANPGPGIHVDDSRHVAIERNRLARNGPAILMDGDDSAVVHNRVTGRGGILVGTGDDNVIVGNRVSGASDSLAVENGSGNLVARNVVLDSEGDGIRLGIGSPPFGGDRNVVRRNLVKRSGDDGFHVYPKDDHSLLKHNVAIGSGDDGFEVDNRTTKLTANRAVRNEDLGIAAVPGVIDGGRNVARHNGDPRECTNIACR
jgi:parallel beta-helix repeat protein